MTRIAGLAGNRGRNLCHIADTAPGNATVSVILTDQEDVPVLDRARERGIPTEVVAHREGENRRDHERRVLDRLSAYEFDLVCLDGYLRVLTDTFLDAYEVVLNVHPSLLPAFPGLSVHEQVLESGVRVSGCTVHVATEEVDAGPIITQEPVPVHADDTVSTLKDRVLHDAEFRAYPRAIEWFAEGRLTVADGEVIIDGDTTSTAGDESETPTQEGFPARRTASDDRVDVLRYGENPHQAAAVYADRACEEPTVASAPQIQGEKGMSYVNYIDADGALDLITEFEAPAAAVIKHANPAGCATASNLTDAYERALATDPMSAFGGVVVLNRPCDVSTAKRIVESVKHVVVAPGYEDGALDALAKRETMRVLDVTPGREGMTLGPDSRTEPRVDQAITGGRLVQERDHAQVAPEDLEVVTDRDPTAEQLESMCFAWQVCKHVTSNAIVFADGTETVGLGVGQVSRVDAVEIAAMKARDHAEGKSADGAVMASDAFFPFPDGIEAAVDAGIEAVVQPGGSIRDEEVIEAANEAGIAMALTGMRAFRHD
jgi:phosphoribosylglycinamide/phosphoribosylaminoimidazolecarboxamide formyltransferase